MKHVSIALLVIAGCFAGCLFGDPDYASTHFSCEITDDCPAGQTCDNMICSGSVGGAGVDCGLAGTCAVGMKCCTTPPTGRECIPVADACADQAASCDQSDDCGADTCCDSSSGPACSSVACDEMVVCVGEADCTDGKHCCRCNPTVPWGLCIQAVCGDIGCS